MEYWKQIWNIQTLTGHTDSVEDLIELKYRIGSLKYRKEANKQIN